MNIFVKITAFSFAAVLFFSCGRNRIDVISAVEDRSNLPSLHSVEVTELISDSGITRYRISTPLWDVFDKADPPYQEFPEGIHLERFDTDLNVDANIHSKYAKYHEKEEIWELRGNVDATNLDGERFETERLFWDQRKERIYSDTLIKITQSDQILYGEGFESNQSLSKYVVNKSYGTFAVETD